MTTLNTIAQNITTSMNAIEIFETVYTHATPVAYDPNWANGTGYFDRACDEYFGELEVSCTTDEYGRKIILISKDENSLVIFERSTADKGLYVTNTPRGVVVIRDSETGRPLRDANGKRVTETNAWHGFESRTQSHTSVREESLRLIVAELLK